MIKAYLAVSAIIGTALGPMSPGTAYVLLHHYMGDVDGNVGAWGYARGGMGSITKALAASLRRLRAARSAPARGSSGSWSSSGRADGRGAGDGDEIQGKRVVSNMDVKRTFLKHVEEKELPDDFVKRVQQLQDPRLLRQAEHRARRRCRSSPALPEGAPEHQGRSALHRLDRADGARL